MSTESSLLATVYGAFEGSVSVLLTVAAGYAACRAGLLDKSSTKRISHLCSSIFLPCLLVVQMAPELTAENLRRVWIVPVWGLVSTLVGHGFGYAGHKLFSFPRWSIIAAGRANASALPLLLIESLGNAGVLSGLEREGESSDSVLSRAKSLILLNVIVQQCLTFAFGPSILIGGEEEDKDRLLPGPNRHGSTIQDSEHVGLLHDYDGEDEDGDAELRRPFRRLQDVPDIHWPEKLQFMQKPVTKILSFLNPPLIGAILAVMIGMIGPLNNAFLNEDGALYNSVTTAVQNLGKIFVSLQMFSVGAQLCIVPSANPRAAPTAFVLLVRFVLMPALSVLFVWTTAGRGWYDSDPLVWFLLVLIPSGPSAMILANLAELVDRDQGPIAGYLTIAYLFSPLIAFTCTAALALVQHLS